MFAVERQQDASELTYLLKVLSAQRNAPLDARDDGMFDEDQLRVALRDGDVDEWVLRLRAVPSAMDHG